MYFIPLLLHHPLKVGGVFAGRMTGRRHLRVTRSFINSCGVAYGDRSTGVEFSFYTTRNVLPFQHALMSAVDYGPTNLLGARFYQPRFLYVNLYRFILVSL
jgi:hypothetical protein